MTAAHELARRGLRVRLVDAAHGPARTSRAVATHPRTLETYDQMGVVDAILPRGRQNRAFTMYAKGRRLVRLDADYSTMPTSYPYTLVIQQTETEAALRDAVARLGVTVEWGVRLTGIEQDDHGVRARLTTADGAEDRIDTSWLVGCDGGHSTVRKLLGLELLGETSETWMLADAPVTTDLPPDTIYWTHTGGQALMMVPYAREGHWRLLDTAPTDRGTDPRGVEEQLTAKLSAGLGREVLVGEAEWTSVFTFQQRMVERMQSGRVFVAGDAAHVHSPASGQGMNTGVQEAYNLAWKLAAVHQGHAGRVLLGTYSEERVPIGRALLGATRTATFLVQLKNLLASVALPVVFSVVRNVPALRRAIQRKVLGGMSGLRIGYADSSLTSFGPPGPDRDRGPGPGERVTAAAVHDAEDRGCRA
ncbi:FAD-dependent monooxygenase, partial [Streptomyces sp. T-3]|nr:FAD-dependent monooxygenase [Streptomyces sp. T-3]